MTGNELTVCELWDVTSPTLPTRSRLYHLAPIGVGTPYVESLTGYVARLAEAHNVWPMKLVAREMLPLLGAKYLSRDGTSHLSPFWSGGSRALNGPWTMSVDWTHVLEQLTLRGELRFLTLQPWVEVLTQLRLLRPKRAWCPACYEEQRQSGREVYEQLLWALAPVRVCARHHQLLSTQCPYSDCGRALSPLESRSRPGYCSRCERWLGISSGMNPAHDGNLDEEEGEWHVWAAESIGELLAAAPTLPAFPRKERIAHAMGVCVEQSARGKASVLAQALGLWPGATWEWLHAGKLPRLDLLLRLCDLLDISLLGFLTEEDLRVGPSRTDRPWMKIPLPRRPPRRPFDVESVRQALEQVLDSEEEPPPSMREIGRRLGRRGTDLSLHFPDLCSAISARYMAYRTARSEEKRQQVCAEVRQAILAIYAQGAYPSGNRVADLLSSPRDFQMPEARAIWRETLQELGW
jgi:transcriptional regulator with XRE-family HTH domain